MLNNLSKSPSQYVEEQGTWDSWYTVGAGRKMSGTWGLPRASPGTITSTVTVKGNDAARRRQAHQGLMLLRMKPWGTAPGRDATCGGAG